MIPGYITRIDHTAGEIIAERFTPLSDYQRMYGCRERVASANPRELEWLCLAETIHAEMVARAEQEVRGGE